MSDIHNRMPVILPQNAYDLWLDSDMAETAILNELLGSYPANRMQAHPVSDVVNTPRNDVADCIEPVELAPPPPEQLSLL